MVILFFLQQKACGCSSNSEFCPRPYEAESRRRTLRPHNDAILGDSTIRRPQIRLAKACVQTNTRPFLANSGPAGAPIRNPSLPITIATQDYFPVGFGFARLAVQRRAEVASHAHLLPLSGDQRLIGSMFLYTEPEERIPWLIIVSLRMCVPSMSLPCLLITSPSPHSQDPSRFSGSRMSA